tara:strand:+ start:498 stop:1001 length:504 start_codon:yes stop_codon:yes gene_type:complete
MKRHQDEIDFLKGAIKETLGINVSHRSNKQEVVMARHIYCSLLKSAGFTSAKVARSLGMDHSSVLYYAKKWESYYDQSSSLRHKYCLVLEKYNEQYNPDLSVAKSGLLEELTALRKENIVLSSQLREQQQTQQDTQFTSLHKLINERTSTESESLVHRKLNAIYNGI